MSRRLLQMNMIIEKGSNIFDEFIFKPPIRKKDIQ
jgi:hypothetical protein